MAGQEDKNGDRNKLIMVGLGGIIAGMVLYYSSSNVTSGQYQKKNAQGGQNMMGSLTQK